MKRNLKHAAAIVLLTGFAVLILSCTTTTPFQRGREAYYSGDYELAIQEFTRQFRSRPCANTLNNRGLAFSRLGDHERAIADFEAALQLDWNNAYARRNLEIERSIVARQRALAHQQQQPQVPPAPSPITGVVSVPAPAQQQQPLAQQQQAAPTIVPAPGQQQQQPPAPPAQGQQQLVPAAMVMSENVLWNGNESTWIEAVNGIRGGGNNRQHTITVSGNVIAPPVVFGNIFGSVTGITVVLEGSGSFVLSGTGNILNIGSEQTVIIRDVALHGRSGNDSPVVTVGEGGRFHMSGSASVMYNDGVGVHVRGGLFIMEDNATVSGNARDGSLSGSGVSISNRGTFAMVNNASVSNNRYNGVSVNNGTFTMLGNASVLGNAGRGVVNDPGTVTMQQSTLVSGNSGGGVYIGVGSFVMQDNASVSENTGRGVSVSGRGASFTMQDNASVSGNTRDGFGAGGGVSIAFGATFTMQDNASVSGNIGGDHGGGGVSITSGATFTMRDNASVSRNTSSGLFYVGGGGVIMHNGNFIMYGGTISGNTTTGDGSGVLIERFGGGNFIMHGGTIVGNITNRSGGGVYIGGGTFTKPGGTVYGNNAEASLRNTAARGHAVFDGRNGNWRNATAGPALNTDAFGFWLNEPN